MLIISIYGLVNGLHPGNIPGGQGVLFHLCFRTITLHGSVHVSVGIVVIQPDSMSEFMGHDVLRVVHVLIRADRSGNRIIPGPGELGVHNRVHFHKRSGIGVPNI